MPSQSLHHILQSCSDPLQTNKWLPIEENRANFHDTCTETLGCETGAMCYANELEVSPAKKQKKKKKKEKYEFPPPLTTLRGEGRLRLRRRREGGRLVLTPFKPSVLESERCNGRLVIWLLPGRGMVEGREGGWREMEEEDEVGVEEMGCFVNGGGGKVRMSGRCNEGDIFNYDSLWVASS